MRLLGALVVLCIWAGMMSAVPVYRADAQTKQAASSDVKLPSEKSSQQPAELGGQAPNARESPRQTATPLWEIVSAHPWWATFLAFVAAVLAIGVGVLLCYASRSPTDPFILRLGPSFFFWLGMAYTGLLLLMAAAYNIWFASPNGYTPVLLGGILFVLIVTASGTPPKFLNTGEATGAKDFIIYYMVAFLGGYREETFRELIKRATDLILRPGTQPPSAPAVTFKVAGVTPLEVSLPATAAGTTSRVAVEVQTLVAHRS